MTSLDFQSERKSPKKGKQDKKYEKCRGFSVTCHDRLMTKEKAAQLIKDRLIHYILVGDEKGEGKDTPHHQVAVWTVDQNRFPAVQKWFNPDKPNAHVEMAHDWDALVEYCKKEGECLFFNFLTLGWKLFT